MHCALSLVVIIIMIIGMAVEDIVSAKLVYDRYLERQGRAKM